MVVSVPASDPLLVDVEVDGRLVAVADLQGGGGFGRVGEADDLLHPDRADLVVEVAEHAAGFDRGELLVVTEQPHHRPGLFGAVDEPVQHQRARHPGLIDQDHRARRDLRLVVVELRQRVRVDAELLRRAHRRRPLTAPTPPTDDRTAAKHRRRPAWPSSSRPRRRQPELHQPTRAAERPHHLQLLAHSAAGAPLACSKAPDRCRGRYGVRPGGRAR